MPYVTERWSGGMLTNFQTTRKSIRKMTSIDKMQTDGTWETLNKRERLFKTRQREKLEKNFGSIADMTRQPAAIFIVDIIKEHIALKEAKRLNIPVLLWLIQTQTLNWLISQFLRTMMLLNQSLSLWMRFVSQLKKD